ncbi:MAG: hypothetical protein WC655_01850 [Candidatus Hydrogenedentales bacterium]|jgi:hypothetical protein
MDREEIREQFSPILDDELTPDERAAIEADLAQDAELLRELHSLKRVDELFRRMPPLHAPKEFEAGVRAKLRPNVLRFPAAVLTRRRALGIAAAAAVLVLVAGVVVIQYRPSRTQFDMASTKYAPEAATAPDLMAQEQAVASDASPEIPAAEAPEEAKEQLGQFDDFQFDRGGSAASSRRGGNFAESAPAAKPAAPQLAARSAGGLGGASPEVERIRASTQTSKQLPEGSLIPESDKVTNRSAPARDAAMKDESKGVDSRKEGESLGYVGDPEEASKAFESRELDAKKMRPLPAGGPTTAPTEVAASEPPASQLSVADAGAPAPVMAAPAPAPPAAVAETPPLVSADTDINGDAVKEDSAWMYSAHIENRKAESAPSTEAAAAPSDAPMPAPPQAAVKDEGAAVDGLQDVQAGGKIGVGVKLSAKSATDEKALPDTKRILGERVFELRDGVWRQDGYKDEAVVMLDRASDVAKQLVEKEPALKDVLAFDKPVIFRAKERWYRVEPVRK